jgi:hypothetical protein
MTVTSRAVLLQDLLKLVGINSFINFVVDSSPPGESACPMHRRPAGEFHIRRRFPDVFSNGSFSFSMIFFPPRT